MRTVSRGNDRRVVAMNETPHAAVLNLEPKPGHFRKLGSVLTAAWIVLSLVAACAATSFLRGQFPFFAVIWLLVCLVSVLRSGDPGRLGIARVTLKDLLLVAVVTGVAESVLTAPFEHWSHTGRKVYEVIFAGTPPDATFLWLRRFPGAAGWGAMVVYSGLVTIFAVNVLGNAVGVLGAPI